LISSAPAAASISNALAVTSIHLPAFPGKESPETAVSGRPFRGTPALFRRR
jgi:hypothetical protein